jgi:hypothetical protein
LTRFARRAEGGSSLIQVDTSHVGIHLEQCVSDDSGCAETDEEIFVSKPMPAGHGPLDIGLVRPSVQCS